LSALGFFGFRTYTFFQEQNRFIHDPIQSTITPAGENIAGSIKLGLIEIPFDRIFSDDTTGDGYLDRRSYYNEYLLTLAAWDTDSDGNYDLWFRFVDGNYVDMEAYDLTKDGRIDKLVSIDENEQIINVEIYEKKFDIFKAVQTLGLAALPLLFFLILFAVFNRRKRS
jgi:hypothetical protein